GGRRTGASPAGRRALGRARPSGSGDPRVRAPVVEVRGSQGAGHPRALRHVGDAVLPGAQRAGRPPGGARRRPDARQAAAAPASEPTAGACGASARSRASI
ncbi:MAG: FIG00822394: hypothetical protein, partial [uncultured Actinomycetospora sp.]